MDPPSKAFFCNDTTTTKTSELSEESEWTMYFDEDLCTGYEASHSPASDAASSVEKRVDEKGGVSGRKVEKSCRKLSLKKWKKKGFEEDDALEDTATSPYSSSKVISKGRQQKATQFRREEVGLIERDSKLKKNGLCLVPLSFAFNYFG